LNTSNRCGGYFYGVIHMKFTVAVVKTSKYAVSTSGDSAEVVERPLGGLSALVVDGQGSGTSAKILSTALAGRASGLINDGIRDGAVARAVHDWLFAQKHGRVSATLSIISFATDTNTLVITQSGNCPVYVFSPRMFQSFDSPTDPLGFYHFSRPQVNQVDLEPGLLAVTFSDGVMHAGRRQGETLDSKAWYAKIGKLYNSGIAPGIMAENILQDALSLDQNRPNDDMTVVVMAILDSPVDGIRRLQVEFPWGKV